MHRPRLFDGTTYSPEIIPTISEDFYNTTHLIDRLLNYAGTIESELIQVRNLIAFLQEYEIPDEVAELLYRQYEHAMYGPEMQMQYKGGVQP